MSTTQLKLKRFLDILISVIGLLLIWPLLLVIALAIKVTSEGPVIFKQKRLGLHGEVFCIWKFRTMILNSEQTEDQFSIETDEGPRMTKVGRLLRATSLDELPQLWNVLRGEMSFIGPRPPVLYYPYRYENYSEEQKRRFMVRPGITGLAQVTVRNAAVWEEKILLDLMYIDKFSIWLDIKILWQTVLVVLQRKNIYRS